MDHKLATQYLVRKVARIIYDTVECSLPDRALSDWQQAERIVRERMCRLADGWGYLEGLPPYPSFEDWDARCGQEVWQAAVRHRAGLPRPPYGRITFG